MNLNELQQLLCEERNAALKEFAAQLLNYGYDFDSEEFREAMTDRLHELEAWRHHEFAEVLRKLNR
jgi:hypothetical protein